MPSVSVTRNVEGAQQAGLSLPLDIWPGIIGRHFHCHVCLGLWGQQGPRGLRARHTHMPPCAAWASPQHGGRFLAQQAHGRLLLLVTLPPNSHGLPPTSGQPPGIQREKMLTPS